ADVQDDLLDARDLHDVAVVELLAQLALHRLFVPLLEQARHLRHRARRGGLRRCRRGLPLRWRGLRRGLDLGRHYSAPSVASPWPQFRQKFSLLPFCRRYPTRVGLLQCVQSRIPFPTGRGPSCTTLTRLTVFSGLAFVWRLPA